MGRVYTPLKIFGYPEKIASLQENIAEIAAPLHVRIKPTNVCNHRCTYCAYRSDDLQLGKDMQVKDTIPREKMMEIINDIIEMDVKAVTFSGGGEPFIYPHLFEVLQKLADSKVKFAALTNGSRLEGETASIFAHYGTWVRVSIDGWDSDSYATYRNVSQQEFGKVLQNMENFHSLAGACFLSVIINVDHRNAPHIYELIQRLTNVGVKSIKVAPVIKCNDNKGNNEYHRPHLDQVAKQIERSQQDFSYVEISNGYQTQLANFTKQYNWCPYLQIRPVIGADQNVYSCQDKAYNAIEGFLFSIRDQSFREAWFKDKASFFKIDPSKMCNHHCVVHEINKMIIEFLDILPDHWSFV